MDAIIAIAGFVGGWLLVAGPVYQAALELKDEGLERDRLQAVQARVARPKHGSAWWWLVPPAKLAMERRNSEQYRREFLASLPKEEAEAMVAFIDKAVGWLYVACGGLLIASKETYELVERFHLGVAWFWALLLVCALASFANTAVRMSRSDALLQPHRKAA